MIKVTELPEGRRERKSQYISSVDSISLPEGGAPASNIRRALLSANAAASAQNGDASNTCISDDDDDSSTPTANDEPNSVDDTNAHSEDDIEVTPV